MQIVIFSHPEFSGAQSIGKYAHMLAEDLRLRGHEVELWIPEEFFCKLAGSPTARKWLGYMDSFILFPLKVKRKMAHRPADTLFVFADQALGPWIPLTSRRPHVVHCHDFMAQRSALGEIPRNRLSLSGRIYQSLIRLGYRKGKNFISVSLKTQRDLHRFLPATPRVSEVVYNGLNQDFRPAEASQVRKNLGQQFKLDLREGFILHVGGNQYYKNKPGVLKIYEAWRQKTMRELPLLLVGAAPERKLKLVAETSEFSADIHFISHVPDRTIREVYQAAVVLLFPSLDEGFGWPIVEALASGCPVITTNAAPMNEIGGASCRYIPPYERDDEKKWAESCAAVLDQVTELSGEDRHQIVEQGILHARRFDPQHTMDQVESIYKNVLVPGFRTVIT